MTAAVRPATPEEACLAVREHARVLPRGGGSKWSLADPPPEAVIVETGGLTGVVEYDPGEFTITVRAGTPVAEVQRLLARHGQYLPFDPLCVDAGATAGGTVAAGVSGACRLRHGGLRDFVLAAAFVDGLGRLVRGGARVVKNAAGFDLPRLLCGSRGRLGLICELTFKVFPLPKAFATLSFAFATAAEAAGAARALLRSPLEPHAVEVAAPPLAGQDYRLLVRVGGPASGLAARLERIEALLGGGGERLEGAEEEAVWRRLRELAWFADQPVLLRLFALPGRMEALDERLARHGARRLFSQGGNAVWAGFDAAPDWEALAAELAGEGAVALCWRGGPPGRRFLVEPPGRLLAERVKEALDPEGKFG